MGELQPCRWQLAWLCLQHVDFPHVCGQPQVLQNKGSELYQHRASGNCNWSGGKMAPEVLELVPVGHMQFCQKMLLIQTSPAWKAGEEVCRKSRAKLPLLLSQ